MIRNLAKNILGLISAFIIVAAVGLLSGIAFNHVSATYDPKEDVNAERCLDESDESTHSKKFKVSSDTIEVIGGYIWGCKWEDSDGDQYWDKDEDPIEGWEIELVDADTDTVIDTTTTDADGYYEFEDLDEGNYIVREVQQDGWIQTSPEEEECNFKMLDEETAEPRDNPNQLWKEGHCIFGNKQGEEEEPTPSPSVSPSVTPSPTPDDNDGNNGGSGSQNRGGSGRQSGDRNPTPTKAPEVQGAATVEVTPSPTQAVLATTGFSLVGIAAIGLLNLQLVLLANSNTRKSLLNLISKIG